MQSKNKELVKNLGILTISNFASKILVFLLVPLYTSILTTEQYGIYDLVVSTISLLMPILTLNIVDAVMRFLMDKNCDKSQVATIGVRYITISIVAAALILLAFNRLNLYQDISGLEIYIFLYYFFYVLNQYLIQLAKGLDKVKEMGVAGVLGTVVMIVSNVAFLLLFKLGLLGFFLANITAQVIPVLYLLICLKAWNYYGFGNYNKQLAKEMLIYCTPLIATTIGWWVNSGSDKYVVTFFCGIATNGILSVAYKIPSILNTLQSIFIQAWQISAVKEYGERDTAVFYGRTFKTINILMCISCSILIIATKPLAHLLYAKDFFVAWEFVPFLLIASVLNYASGFLGPILSAKKDSKAMAMSAVYGAVVNLVLNIAFVYFIGGQGVTIATVIASFIIYQVRKNAVGKEISITNYKMVITTWIILVGQAVIEIYIQKWWLEIILIIAIIVLNFADLKIMCRSLKNGLITKMRRK